MGKSRSVIEAVCELDLTPHSITCVCLVNTRIYIGGQSGVVILLSLEADTKSLQFVKTLVVGSNKSAVQSINLVRDGVILVVCDECLFLLDSLLTQPPKKLQFFRGITLVAQKICVSHRTTAPQINSAPSTTSGLLHILASGIISNGDQHDDNLDGDDVFALVVGKRLLLVQLDINVYSLVILKEFQCIDGVKAMVWLDDSIILATSNGYTLFSSLSGQSHIIFSLPHDVSSLPLLKLLNKDRKVLLLVDNVGVVVDVHGHPVGGSLVFRRTPDAIGDLSMYVVIVVGDGKIELYHKSSGVCVQTLTFVGEGCIVANDESTSNKFFVVTTPKKIICFQKVPAEDQIKHLLRNKDFKEAISLTEELEREGEISKEMLYFVHAQVGFLLLFDLHFQEAVDHFLQSETMQPSEVFPFIMRDPNRWSLLVPRNRYWGLHPPPAPLEDVVNNGLLTIQRAIFLKKAGVETAIDDNFLSNPPSRADLLESAIKNIIRYLEVSREKDLTIPVKEGVDTLLMYLYRSLNHVHDMEKLAASENSCIVEELETLLDESGHLRTLAFLYSSKGMSSKALAIWRVLARNFSSGLWKDPVVENNICDGSMDATSGKEIVAMEASKILQESSDENLVLQHLGWVSDINPSLAVKVLTSDKRPHQLSPERVIPAIDSKKVEILQSYLQWLIDEQDSHDTQFHTLYALSLAKSALETFEAAIASSNSAAVQLEEAKDSDFGNNLCCLNPARERLQIFLQSSDLYDPEEVLDLIEGSELWLEKAILYRKLGQETLVLQILALKLEDSEAAEQYCTEIGRPDAYMQLLDMYLDPQDGKEPMFKAAVRLLHNHGESLDPLQVLETLSPDMPLQLASDTILRMLRARLHHRFHGQIVHNLSRAVNIDARLARLEERSRHVQINDESLCDSCQARLGTKLFAMYPDDTIVCYKCFRRQGESTSITGRDFKEDILFKSGWLVMR